MSKEIAYRTIRLIKLTTNLVDPTVTMRVIIIQTPGISRYGVVVNQGYLNESQKVTYRMLHNSMEDAIEDARDKVNGSLMTGFTYMEEQVQKML